jgi:hypothetical protein
MIQEQVSCSCLFDTWSLPWRVPSFRDQAKHDWERFSLKIYLDQYFRCLARSIYIQLSILRLLVTKWI